MENLYASLPRLLSERCSAHIVCNGRHAADDAGAGVSSMVKHDICSQGKIGVKLSQTTTIFAPLCLYNISYCLRCLQVYEAEANMGRETSGRDQLCHQLVIPYHKAFLAVGFISPL